MALVQVKPIPLIVDADGHPLIVEAGVQLETPILDLAGPQHMDEGVYACNAMVQPSEPTLIFDAPCRFELAFSEAVKSLLATGPIELKLHSKL